MHEVIRRFVEEQDRNRRLAGLDQPGALSAAMTSSAMEVVRQHELQAKHASDLLARTSGTHAAAEAMRESVSNEIKLRELSASFDRASAYAVGSPSLQHIAQQIAQDPTQMRDYSTYALGGLSHAQSASLDERFGAIRLGSMVAMAMDEAANMAKLSGYAVNIGERFSRDAGYAAAGRIGLAAFEASKAARERYVSLITQAAGIDKFIARAFDDTTSVAMLAQRMERMNAPWLDTKNELHSVASFARLQAIGDVVANATPYATSVGSWLRGGGLGDWRDSVAFPDSVETVEGRTQIYVEQGVDIEAVESDTEIFVESAGIASLFASDEAWAELWVPAAVEEEKLAALGFVRLRKFEMMVRAFLRAEMERAFGPKWMKQRLPNGLLDLWKDRQDKAKGTSDFDDDLLSYADFTDYIRIIERNDNWKDLFEAIFIRREDVKESLQRLHPLRLATMHARCLSTTDLLLMLCETKRISNALERWENG